MSLESFMLKDEVKEVEYSASNRFKDKEGNIEKWKLRTITADENDNIRKQCYKQVQVGKRMKQEFDTVKYLELLEYKGYSYVVYDYDKNTKELTEKYRYNGSNKIEEIDFSCKYCDRYKEKNFIDIFELLKMKEEEEKRKLEKSNLEKENS